MANPYLPAEQACALCNYYTPAAGSLYCEQCRPAREVKK